MPKRSTMDTTIIAREVMDRHWERRKRCYLVFLAKSRSTISHLAEASGVVEGAAVTEIPRKHRPAAECIEVQVHQL